MKNDKIQHIYEQEILGIGKSLDEAWKKKGKDFELSGDSDYGASIEYYDEEGEPEFVVDIIHTPMLKNRIGKIVGRKKFNMGRTVKQEVFKNSKDAKKWAEKQIKKMMKESLDESNTQRLTFGRSNVHMKDNVLDEIMLEEWYDTLYHNVGPWSGKDMKFHEKVAMKVFEDILKIKVKDARGVAKEVVKDIVADLVANSEEGAVGPRR